MTTFTDPVGPITSGILPYVEPTRIYVPTDWRIVLCDVNGAHLKNISRIASQKTLSYRLNRPASFSFVVPSDDPAIISEFSDGFPYLETMRRTIKCYRHEGDKYVLRFAGYISSIQDAGDAATAKSSVTCYDPMQRLQRRLVRDASGDATVDVVFTDIDGAQIAKDLVDRTNTYAGNVGIATTGTFEATDHRTQQWQALSKVGDAVNTLTQAFNGFDIAMEPVDQDDGVLVEMSAYEKRGSTLENIAFIWGLGGSNVVTVSRLSDGEQVANDIHGAGSTDLRTNPTDATSISDFGRYEDASSYADVTNQDFLDALGEEELSLRKNPRDLVSIVPQPGLPTSPEPFIDYFLGDVVNLFVGPRLRGGFAGMQRIYGLDISLDDNSIERVTSIVATPDG